MRVYIPSLKIVLIISFTLLYSASCENENKNDNVENWSILMELMNVYTMGK